MSCGSGVRDEGTEPAQSSTSSSTSIGHSRTHLPQAMHFEGVGPAMTITPKGQASTHFTIRSVNGDKTSTYITKVDEWAPLAYAARDLPPMLIQTGENEIDIPCRAEENRLLYASLLALGHRDVQHCAYAGRRHGTMSRDVKYYEDDFIHRHIREIDDAAFSDSSVSLRTSSP